MAKLAPSSNRETENYMGIQDTFPGCPLPHELEENNICRYVFKIIKHVMFLHSLFKFNLQKGDGILLQEWL